MPVMGGCPYCNASMDWIEVPPNAPGWCKEVCADCGKTVWRWITRVNPQAWKEEDFLAQYEVDEERRAIFTRPGKTDTVMADYNVEGADLARVLDFKFTPAPHHPQRE